MVTGEQTSYPILDIDATFNLLWMLPADVGPKSVFGATSLVQQVCCKDVPGKQVWELTGGVPASLVVQAERNTIRDQELLSAANYLYSQSCKFHKTRYKYLCIYQPAGR